MDATAGRIRIDAEAARTFAAELLIAAGASSRNATIVADHLVDSSRRGALARRQPDGAVPRRDRTGSGRSAS